MAKYRCCRFHHLFTLVLALAALSLAVHFVVDIAHLPQNGGANLQSQQDTAELSNEQAVGHPTGLHGGVILVEMSAYSVLRAQITVGDISNPLELAWVPPTPVRPPIIV